MSIADCPQSISSFSPVNTQTPRQPTLHVIVYVSVTLPSLPVKHLSQYPVCHILY